VNFLWWAATPAASHTEPAFGTWTDSYGAILPNDYTSSSNELWVALAEKTYVQMN
jgi:hypothetical protein